MWEEEKEGTFCRKQLLQSPFGQRRLQDHDLNNLEHLREVRLSHRLLDKVSFAFFCRREAGTQALRDPLVRALGEGEDNSAIQSPW